MLKRAVAAVFKTALFNLIYVVLGTETAAAEEAPTAQVTPASDSVLTQIDTSTATIAIAQVKVDSATAETTAAAATLATATATAAPSVATDTTVVAAVSTAQTAVVAAQTAITAADSATAVAVTAIQAVDSQTAVVTQAVTTVDSATAVVTTATAAVDSQTAVVVTETSELTVLQNTPSDSKTYTTAGYVAPVAPETPTVTTVTLPTMYDGYTKVSTPFDVKIGNTVYEGQGTASQIYVTSKATITFGVGDYNYWDFPAGAHISVFGSDFMSDNANGSSTVVKTTETTLEVDWNLHLFGNGNSPITNVNWLMTVNPDTGEWTGVGKVAGNTTQLYGGPRIGVREATGQPIKPMTNVTNESLTAQIESQTVVVATETAVLTTLTEVKKVAVT